MLAQGVPAHIGTPTPGHGYESGDPYASFLPSALRIGVDASEDDLRAVVFVVSLASKGTSRSAQEYESPLLILSGTEYATASFQVLYNLLCDALRGSRPRPTLEILGPGPATDVIFEDGSRKSIARKARD